MAYSNSFQAGAHVVTSAEQSGSSATITLGIVNPVSFHVHRTTSAGVMATLVGATITLTVGTETSGVWSNATLTVANALTAGDILYWMVA